MFRPGMCKLRLVKYKLIHKQKNKIVQIRAKTENFDALALKKTVTNNTETLPLKLKVIFLLLWSNWFLLVIHIGSHKHSSSTWYWPGLSVKF